MADHVLKTVEPFFSAVLSGEKTFEVRRNDRAFQRGDTLTLVDASKCDCSNIRCEKRRPPIRKEITYVFAGTPALRDLGGVVPGYVVLGLGEIEASLNTPGGDRAEG